MDEPAVGDRLPPVRSILFVPGDRPDRYGKALAAGADAICIDLEDAVAPGAKAGARESVASFLAGPETPGPTGAAPPGAAPTGAAPTGAAPTHGRRPLVIVRVNDPASDEGAGDAASLAGGPAPDAFMIPKVTTDAGIRDARRLLGDVPLIPIIETVHGLENVVRIGAAAPAVAALIFGGFDFSVELGAEPEWEPLLYARSRVVHAAALGGIDAIDMPSRDLTETSRLRAETERARRLGFTGKVAIHPAQIPAIHDVFTPSREQVERARRIVSADRDAGGGAVALDGRMVDRPVVEAARRMLERAGERAGERVAERMGERMGERAGDGRSRTE